MKITCGACHASYNLPDEKVAGRRVKVRCKRCSEPIVVDGVQVPSIPAPPPDFEDEATRVMDSPLSGNTNMWTVNLSETEQGDMTDEELVAGWQAGIVTEDAYVWRDGMDDWKPILDVPELVSLLSQATRVEPSSPEREPVSAEAEPGSLEPAAPGSPSPPAAHAKRLGSSPFAGPSLGAGSQLGGAQQGTVPSPLGAGPAGFSPALPRPPGARSNADLFTHKPKREKPKYEASEARNENSVLFSLDALKAAAAATTSDAPPKSNRVDENLLTMGLGSNDVFSAPLIQVETAPPPAHPAQRGASVGPAAAASYAPDGISPVKQGGGKGWFVAAVLVVLLGGGGMFMYGSYLNPDAAVPTATPSVAPPSATAVAKEVPAEVEPANTVEPSEAEKDKGENRGSEGIKEARPNDSDKPSSDRPSSDKPASDAPASDTPKPPTGGGTPPTKEEEKEETSDAPPFNTEAARAALAGAASQAASCKALDGPTGTGKVQVTFVASGRVTSAQVVSGPFGGTAVGGCVARTFRQARVPAFSGESQIVSKSFKIE